MTPTELALAKEWRAYVGSFIRTGEYVDFCVTLLYRSHVR